MKPPTAALFDIGNVLVHVDFQPALLKLIPPGTADPKVRIESLLEKKDEYESGALSDDEFVPWASRRLGFEGSPEEFRAAWCSIFSPVTAMWPVVSFLRSLGTRLFLFSNTNGLHADWLLENVPDLRELFEAAVFSHEVGAIKPDEAIYHFATRTHGLDPTDTLYIDDLPENIATGHRLGFRSHQYDASEHHRFVAWLDEQFGVPPGGTSPQRS